MPFAAAAPFIFSGLSALGGLFGNKQSNERTTPSQYRPLENQLLRGLGNRLQNPGLPEGYESQGILGINDSFEGIGRTLNNSLVSRGLSTSPQAAASDRNLNFARAGELSRFRGSLPGIEREFQNQDFGLAAQLLGQSQGQQVTGNGGAGGGLGGLDSALGFLAATGQLGGLGGQQQKKPGQQVLGNPYNAPPYPN